jgi:hypothetical protein
LHCIQYAILVFHGPKGYPKKAHPPLQPETMIIEELEESDNTKLDMSLFHKTTAICA